MIPNTKCQDGCGGDISDDLKTVIEALSFALGGVIVTSGYRCLKHNQEVGGVPDSAHTKGLAADISCKDGAYRLKLVLQALKSGIMRIGIGKTFVHIDIDHSKPDSIWLYP